jgi:hypothetical protein
VQVIGHENCMMNFNYSSHYQQMLDVRLGQAEFEYGFFEYVVHWVVYIIGSIFGIRSFPYYYVNHLHSLAFVVLGLIASIVFLFKRKWKNFEKIMVFIVAAFAGIVFLYNWADYLETVEIGRTAHGRYLLPVLPLVLVFISMQLAKIQSRRRLVKMFLLMLSVVLFLTGFGAYYQSRREDIGMDWTMIQRDY